MKIEWGHGSGFNLGRLEGTGIRVERFWTGTPKAKRWRFLLSDDKKTYMHVDDREFATVEELEVAAVDWLVQAGRLIYRH